MNKLTKAILAAALITPATASAYTLDELFGSDEMTVIETCTRSLPLADELPPIVSEITYSRIPGNDTQIKVKNISNSNRTFVLTLIDAAGRESADGTRFRIYDNECDLERSEYALRPLTYTEIDQTANAKYTFTGNSAVYFDIKKDDFGNYQLHSSTPVYVGTTSVSSPNNTYVYQNIASVLVPANSVTTLDHYTFWTNPYYGTYGRNDSPKQESFPSLVCIDRENNRFGICNLSGRGLAHDYDLTLNYITGTINGNKFTFDVNQDAIQERFLYVNYNYYGTAYSWGKLSFALRRFDWESRETYDDLTATYQPTGLNHNNAPHAWVTNKGRRRTIDGFILSVDHPFTYQFLGSLDGCIDGYYDYSTSIYYPPSGPEGYIPGSLNFIDEFQNTEFDGGDDVTVDVKLNLDKVGVDNDNILVTGNIETRKNDMYVDHYELYAVPGHFNTIEDEGFSHHLDNGHEAALNIHDAQYSFREDQLSKASRVAKINADGSAVGTHDYQFSRLIPRSHIGTAENPEHYTFFIKAVYKNEHPQLTPTFHDLQYRDINTGVEDLVAEGAASIKAGHGVITVSGTDAAVEVFNASGALIYEGTDRSISVGAGLYIVKAGRTVAKVVVR